MTSLSDFSPKLHWPSKSHLSKPMGFSVRHQKVYGSGTEEAVLFEGDNLSVMMSMVERGETCELIYMDPPFASKADYFERIGLHGKKKYIRKKVYGDKYTDNRRSTGGQLVGWYGAGDGRTLA